MTADREQGIRNAVPAGTGRDNLLSQRRGSVGPNGGRPGPPRFGARRWYPASSSSRRGAATSPGSSIARAGARSDTRPAATRGRRLVSSADASATTSTPTAATSAPAGTSVTRWAADDDRRSALCRLRPTARRRNGRAARRRGPGPTAAASAVGRAIRTGSGSLVGAMHSLSLFARPTDGGRIDRPEGRASYTLVREVCARCATGHWRSRICALGSRSFGAKIGEKNTQHRRTRR